MRYCLRPAFTAAGSKAWLLGQTMPVAASTVVNGIMYAIIFVCVDDLLIAE